MTKQATGVISGLLLMLLGLLALLALVAQLGEAQTRTVLHLNRGIDQVAVRTADGGYTAAVSAGTPVLVLVFDNGLKLTEGVDYVSSFEGGTLYIRTKQPVPASALVTVSVLTVQ